MRELSQKISFFRLTLKPTHEVERESLNRLGRTGSSIFSITCSKVVPS
jgi:hypothetical protein